MTTHQEDFHRMALTGWLAGWFGIKSWVECGVLEGETAGYFSQFTEGGIGFGCDLDEKPLAVGRQRYPGLKLEQCDSSEWLKRTVPILPALFYLDSMWKPTWPGLEEIKIIKSKWPSQPIMVNGLKPSETFIGLHPVEPLQQFGRVIVPDYSYPFKVAGYGVIVPDGALLPAFRHWKVLPKN